MNNKIKLPVILLASVCLLASCNEGGGEDTPVENIPVTSIKLSRMNVGMIIEEGQENPTTQLEYSTFPVSPKKATLKFSSSDESIASVDASGKITGKKVGNAVITAKNLDGTVSSSVNVFVTQKATKAAATKAAKAISSAQTAAGISSATQDAYRLQEYLKKTVSIDGVAQETSDEYSDMTVSRSEAMFHYTGNYWSTKVEGGSAEFEEFGWIIYTTESYMTYLFHISGDVRNYMVADSSSFISAGKTRFQATCAILDSLFTSGSGFVVNGFDSVVAKDELNSAKSADTVGIGANGEINYKSATTGEQTADIDDESDYQIPCYSKYNIEVKHDVVIGNTYLNSDKLYQALSWVVDGKQHKYAYDIEEYYDGNPTVSFPDKEQFTKVDTIFDL